MLSILTMNIGAASAKRAAEICNWLAARPESIFILTETSGGDGTALIFDRFRSAGYEVVSQPEFGGERGAAIISRVAIDVSLVDALSDLSIPVRVAGAVIKTEPAMTVLGIYVPSRDASSVKVEKKRDFIESIMERLRRLSPGSIATTVVGGDYNVIDRTHRPLHSGFLDFEFSFLSGLEALGLRDAQQIMRPGEQVYSWVGRTGDGYKYDYFHVGPGLETGLGDVTYIEDTRALGLTDHSAVTMTLTDVIPDLLEVREIADPIELELLF